MISIPDVTLVAAETRAHDLARATLNDCVQRVKFGGVLIHSNDPAKIAVPDAEYRLVKDWPNKREAGQFYYTDAAHFARTSHVLLTEWDGGINDASQWSDEFLEYDYIGSPWGPGVGLSEQGKDVGNGGFSLWSKKLCDFVYEERERFPIEIDLHISQTHRPALEKLGFKWAPTEVARRFGFEGWTRTGYSNPSERPTSFGYHGIFTWPLMLARNDLIQRARMIRACQFLVKTGKLSLLLKYAPWLSHEIRFPVMHRGMHA